MSAEPHISLTVSGSRPESRLRSERSPGHRRTPLSRGGPCSAEGSVSPCGGLPQSLHASCVVIGESGILIRGASGAGKSSLARMLVSQARERGAYAAFVADDRVLLAAKAGRLVAAPHPRIAGRFEMRGLAIASEAHEPQAVVRLLVDLEEEVERLPSRAALTARIADVAVPRLLLVAGRFGLYETSLVFCLAQNPKTRIDFADGLLRETES